MVSLDKKAQRDKTVVKDGSWLDGPARQPAHTDKIKKQAGEKSHVELQQKQNYKASAEVRCVCVCVFPSLTL